MSDAPPARFGRGSAAAAGVGVACVALLTLLFEEVRRPFPFLNDGVYHFGLIEALASALARGQSLLDPWVPTWCLGYPVFHYYQSLPHFVVLGLWKLLGGTVSLVQVFKIVEWLAVGTFPLPVFLAMRRLGFDRGQSLAAAVLSPLIKTNYLHGHDFESYVWQGLGQYSQAFGGWLFPLAVAWTVRALREGRGLGTAAILLAATFLSHLALGTIAALSGVVAALVVPRDVPRRLLRLAFVGVVAFAGCAWMLVPIAKDFAWYNICTLVPSWKYQSFGAAIILPWLVHGDLFDFARSVKVAGHAIGPLPVLTGLVLGGLAYAAWRVRREKERTLLALFLFSLALYFGRPTWGDLLRLVPGGAGFHYSRAIFGVHVFGTMLAGAFLGAVVGRLAAWRRGGTWIAAGVTILVLAPLALERAAYLRWNASLVRESAAGYAKEGPALERAIAVAAEDRLGRSYAGLGGPGTPWGGTFLVGWVPVYAWFPFREIDALGYLYHMASLNADLHDAFDERSLADFRALGVRTIVAPPEVRTLPSAREIAREGRFRVLRVDGPGLVDLVDVPFRIDVSKRNVSRVHRKWLRGDLPGRNIFPEIRLREERKPEDGRGIRGDGVDFRFPAVEATAGPVGEVLEARREGEDFFVRVRVDRPGHLVLKMTYHPLWKAVVDGTPVPTVHLMPSFVGVALAPGVHEVQLRYRAERSRGVLCVAGVLVLVAAGALGRRLVL